MRKKQVVYLAGAMDTVPDRGLGWRKVFAKALSEINIDVIIPNNIEKISPVQVSELKAKNLNKFKNLFRKHIILPDLAALDSCSTVVVFWNGEAIAGTAHECGHAFMRNQPVFLVTPKSFIDVPNWLLACCDKQFHTIDELIKYLKRGWKPKK